MKKVLGLVLCLCMLVVSVSALAQAPAEQPSELLAEGYHLAASTVLDDLNIAYMPNYASLWSVVTGVRKGFFVDEGLNVHLVEFADGPTIIAAMESGSIDMGYIGPGAHKLCIQGRAKIFMLSQIGNADAVLVRRSRGINTYADLKGKKIGYASGTSSEMILQYALEEAGLTMDDIQPFEMEVSSLVTAMISGSIDACAAWSPNTGTIIASAPDDIYALCSNSTFANRSVSPASWIVLSSYYEGKEEIVQRFARALYRAMDYGSDPAHFDEVAGYVAEQCGVDKEVALAQVGDADWPDSATIVKGAQDGTIEGYYKVQQDAFINSGAVAEAVPVTDYVLFNVMIDAAK